MVAAALKRTRLIARARPRSCRTRIPHQLKSISYHLNPGRAEVGWAWWLLCQPSPKVSKATHQLLVERSRVIKRREPQLCVAEFTSQVVCSPTTVRKKTPHRRNGKP